MRLAVAQIAAEHGKDLQQEERSWVSYMEAGILWSISIKHSGSGSHFEKVAIVTTAPVSISLQVEPLHSHPNR